MRVRVVLSAVLLVGGVPVVQAVPEGVVLARDSVLVSEVACSANQLSPNDDGSTASVPIGFSLDFYGSTRTRLYVNNNGNVTFDAPLSTYTPFPLANVTREIIAPFFGDVDTRGVGSEIVRYGYGSVVFEGRPAFCATWKNVGYYASHADKLNSFQLLLVDRSDRAAGDFDIVFNYDKIKWESGDASGGNLGLGGSPARAGFSNGTGLAGTSYELPGSGVAGALLDSSPSGLITRAFGSAMPGRQVFAVTSGRPNLELSGNTMPDFDDWHLGDVHAHAAGDTNLIIHPACENQRSEAECAEYLVADNLARAGRFGSEWIIFTEHGPWLGFQRNDYSDVYSHAQGHRQWDLIKAELDRQSTPELRGLIGEELGTAAPACSAKGFESPGHFSIYYTPTYIENGLFDCNETGASGYLGKALEEDPDVFGAVNHPDNDDGGSRWHCWTSGADDNGQLRGEQHQPQTTRMEPCTIGIDTYNDTVFRGMEIINGHNLPSARTLELWDMFLQNGYEVAAVGGSDGHTAPRKLSKWGGFECLGSVLSVEPRGVCIDLTAPEADANHGKTGGSGGTLAWYPASSDLGFPSYTSANPTDPARTAIAEGRTTATNGPRVIAQIGGKFPGDTVEVPSGLRLPVRIDWKPEFATSLDSRSRTEDFLPEDVRPRSLALVESEGGIINRLEYLDAPGETRFEEADPVAVYVVSGQREGCGSDRRECAGGVTRTRVDLSASDLSRNWAEIVIDSPGESGFVRVEAYYDTGAQNETSTDFDRDYQPEQICHRRGPCRVIGEGSPRFHDNVVYDYGAFTSPIFTDEVASVEISGRVVLNETGVGVAGAPVEICHSNVDGGRGTCERLQTGTGGVYGPIAGTVGYYIVRAFPPVGMTDRLSQTTDVGDLAAGARRSVTVRLSELSPVPAAFVPTGATVRIDGGVHVMWHDPLTLVGAGCAGGSASYAIALAPFPELTGSMTETAVAGEYEAVIDRLEPMIGPAAVSITVVCPTGGATTTTAFTLYIDPAGVVVDTDGVLLDGVTVTLWESPDRQAAFTPVADGSAVMSPANRTNPAVTDDTGTFSWDVITGYYRVTASKPGCTAAGTDGQTEARTPTLRIPPAALDLVLVLDCRPPDTTNPTLTITSQPGAFTNNSTATVAFTLSDNQPGVTALCGFDEMLYTDEDEPFNEVPCTSPYEVAGLADGVHEILIIARDEHLNFVAEKVTFTVDSTPPVITVDGVIDGTVYPAANAPTPTCSVTDDLSGVPEPCQGSIVPSAEVGRQYTYTASATDRAGNTSTVTVTYSVEAPDSALWATSTAAGAISIQGSITGPGLIHTEGGIDIRGQANLTGGVEHVGSFTRQGQINIQPAPLQVAPGAAHPRVRALDDGIPSVTIPTPSVVVATSQCTAGTWTPTAAQLVDAVISVPCAVTIGWAAGRDIPSTIVANGPIRVQGNEFVFTNTNRPSLISTGPAAAIQFQVNRATVAGAISAEGPVTIQGNEITLGTTDGVSVASSGARAAITLMVNRASVPAAIAAQGPISIQATSVGFSATRPLVAVGTNASVTVRSNQANLGAGIVTTGKVVIEGTTINTGCGLYAGTITIRAATTTASTCAITP